MTQSLAVRQASGRAVRQAAAAGLPWAEALREHWRTQFGECAEGEEIVELLTHSLAPTTAASYGRHVARFAAWCASQPDKPSPLPASTSTVVRWLVADVVVGDRVKADSLQPYLSAVNRVHRDLELDEPALGHVVQQVRRAVALRQADLGRDGQRVYLPAPVMERVLEWALSQPLEALRGSAALAELYRAAAAVVLVFVIFCRGDTGSSLRAGDVRRSAAGISITLDREKGKRIRGVARVITLPPGAVPGLEQLLSRWEALRGGVADDAPYLAFDGERSLPSTQIDTWLQRVLGHLGERPPASESWSGHSLRKGAASGAGAIDIPLFRICYIGGWSIKSHAVHDYIDATCPDTPAARRFFGWLARR